MPQRDTESEIGLDEEGTLRAPVSIKDERSKRLIRATLPFAKASRARAWFQLSATLALTALTVAAIALSALVFVPLIAVLLGGLIVRLFVLEHDCGHNSFFPSRAANQRCGTFLSIITGTSLKAWSAEHNWHHNFQGQLDRRGIDIVNSPMTVDEARLDPRAASRRERLISVKNVMLYGMYSMLLRRRRPAGYFTFRKAWRHGVPNRRKLIVDVWRTNLLFLSVNAASAYALGGVRWLLAFPLAYALAAAVGGFVFFVHHNFEHTYFARTEDWTWADVSLRGSSWMALPRALRWFTADICIHHVHHLNPRVPNYYLEAARRAIPELASIKPLSRQQIRRCYTHLFWDEKGRVMIPFVS